MEGKEMIENLKVLIYGAGAVGSSIGGWVYPGLTDRLCFKARGAHASSMKENGLYLYLKGKKDEMENYPIKVIDDLSEAPDTDIIILTVKNYDLETAAKEISSLLGKDKKIVGMQNGVKNQEILPKYFNKIIYGVVCFNAWMDEPGTIGYKERGPIVLGTIDGTHKDELNQVVELLNLGVNTEISENIQDAIHTKAVLNSLNALYTLVGLRYKEIDDYKLLGKITRKILSEGIEIVQKAGYDEYKLGNLASWRTIKLADKLPGFISTWLYKRKLKVYVLSSTASDFLIRKKDKNELDSLNGYLIDLAAKMGTDAFYNKCIYDICKEKFSNPETFEPLSVQEVWDYIEKKP
jgi:2-dehydropantoate 2-reductase